MKFDPAAEWAKLSAEQQEAVGMAGLTLQVATEAVEIIDEQATGLPAGDPELRRLVELERRWEAAEGRAWTLLRETVPQDADLFDEGPTNA